MPTLLQINVTSNWGSTGKIAEQIGLCAQKHGWESYIAYGRMSNPSKNNTIKVGSMYDVYEHYAEGKFMDNEGLASRNATKRFLNEIDSIKPDVVHLHNIHDHFMNYRLLFSYLAKKEIPVVWTQHDQWSTTGHCMYNTIGCELWKTECHDCPLSAWYSLDRSTRNHRLKKQLMADIPSLTIVPVSDWLSNNIKQSHLKDRPIEVIHNGIDINTFSPQEVDVHKTYGIPEDKKIILGVAAVWDERKGLKDFYKLAQELAKEDYAIVIVGKVAVEKKSSGDGCQMVFVDSTQNALELAQLYSSASVFVNPTYQDNYPTTNLEAMSCGTPVITYNTGGSPEAVTSETGIVVAQGDIEGLKNAIIKFSSRGYRDACRKRAIEYFDNSKCFNQYIKLYNRLLGGGKFLVLGVSSVWNNDKGLADFIELSKNPKLLIVLVGVSDVVRKQLPDEIVAISRTQNQKELALLYSMADVFVNPTYADMFPTVNLEALACGTPVITYKTGGSPEAVDAKTGIVVEQGNVVALANAIMYLRDNPLASEDCRKRAEELFDKDKCFEKYIELYEELLSKSAQH